MMTARDPAVHDVLALFEGFRREGFRAWLAGGWAVDALEGAQTRVHADVDVAVDAGQLERVLSHLADYGFCVSVDQLPSRVELTGDYVLDLHPVVFAPDGSGTQAGLDGDSFPYAPDGFTAGSLDGVDVPCLAARQQRAFRTGYPPRPVDAHDLLLLRRNCAD
jgi:lincosamide nucleotidyltransferase A/C/D/E